MRDSVWTCLVVTSASLVFCVSGCGLREVRTKTKFGVEARHTNRDKSDVERYLVQEALQFKWDNGVDTSLIYRRRDLSNSSSSDSDDGVWFEIGVPIWKAPKKPDEVKSRVAELERRLAELEQTLNKTEQSGSVIQPVTETAQ